MKIYYKNESTYASAVSDILAEYDIGNLAAGGSVKGDGVLDDYEIKEAGGIDNLMQLIGSCFGIKARGPLGEYDVAAVSGENCSPSWSKRVAVQASNRTPNGRVYPGIIIDIPGGEFEMGTACDGRHGIDGTHDPDEHTGNGKTVRVKISDFRLAKTEVTVGQYITYLMERFNISRQEAEGRLPDYNVNKKGDNFPVVGLLYKDMKAFAEYYGGTLPTAAQIEYASKGPSHTDPYGTPIDKAIIWSNGARTTAEVCGPNDERSNGWACDLAGNVLETTSDKYDPNSYGTMSTTDPANPFTGGPFTAVEQRGGSFRGFARYARAAGRGYVGPVFRYNSVGFRCVWPQ